MLRPFGGVPDANPPALPRRTHGGIIPEGKTDARNRSEQTKIEMEPAYTYECVYIPIASLAPTFFGSRTGAMLSNAVRGLDTALGPRQIHQAKRAAISVTKTVQEKKNRA